MALSASVGASGATGALVACSEVLGGMGASGVGSWELAGMEVSVKIGIWGSSGIIKN